MFYDETKVFLKAGNGGDGCMSFLRQKYMPNGGPNGGNGGKGGDLILKADENVADLRNYHFKKHWKAKNGEPVGVVIKTERVETDVFSKCQWARRFVK